MKNVKPVVAIDAHKASCTYVVRHWDQTLVKPKRIPSTRAALTRLAKTYPDHDFVLEVCSVHEWMMDLFRTQGVNAMAVIPPRTGPVGKKSDDDDATRLAKKHQAGELQEVYIAETGIRTLRDLVREHEFLKTRWVSANNYLKHFLNRWNFQPSVVRGVQRKPDVYCEEGRKQVLEQFPHLAATYAVLDVLHEQMTHLKQEIELRAKPMRPHPSR